jgi:hypothetical protein
MDILTSIYLFSVSALSVRTPTMVVSTLAQTRARKRRLQPTLLKPILARKVAYYTFVDGNISLSAWSVSPPCDIESFPLPLFDSMPFNDENDEVYTFCMK